MEHAERRTAFRTPLPDRAIAGLSFRLADGLGPGDPVDATTLGAPILAHGRHKTFSLSIADISATGMSVVIHSPSFASRRPKSFTGRLVFLHLRGVYPDPDKEIECRLLAETVTETLEGETLTLSMRFVAEARPVTSQVHPVLFDIRKRGHDRLAAWCNLWFHHLLHEGGPSPAP
ncbi:MAG: hypothetical protein AB7E47_13560 [Desulfovibrionaceae bacterium]